MAEDPAKVKPCGCPVRPKKNASGTIPKSIQVPIESTPEPAPPDKVENDAQEQPESEIKPDESPEEVQSPTESKPDESPEEVQPAAESKQPDVPFSSGNLQEGVTEKPCGCPIRTQQDAIPKSSEVPIGITPVPPIPDKVDDDDIQEKPQEDVTEAPPPPIPDKVEDDTPEKPEENVTEAPPAPTGRDTDGLIKLPNPNVKKMAPDQLQYLAMNTREHNLAEMFGDVKFVVMSVAKKKMEYFTNYIKKEMGIQLPLGAELIDISKAPNRYAMYKIGPVLAVSHGMGHAAVNITVNEVIRLVYHAGAKNPIFLRTGTCVGIGLEPGTVVISESVFNPALNECQEISVMGKTVQRPAKLDEGLARELLAQARADDGYEVVSARTMSTNDLYEEQGRMNGAFCTYSLEEKEEFLNKLSSQGIKAMDLESLPFAAVTYNTGVLAANVTVVILNRLVEDDVSIPDEKVEAFQRRPCHLVTRFIKNYYDNVDV